MIELYPNLFVGDDNDAQEVLHKEGWFIVHACKEPYHRKALGYVGRGAPKNHPEYLIAKRENRLILNLVDAPKPEFIPNEIMFEAVKAVAENIIEKKVLVHCNQGKSRSPTIALLYLLKHTDIFDTSALNHVLSQFKALYPSYEPAGGVSGFVENNWREYIS